jgi:hypothetical protein
MREIPEEELEYLAREKTQSEIAKIYNCSQMTIQRRMKEYDIRRCRGLDILDDFLSYSFYDPVIDMLREEEDD